MVQMTKPSFGPPARIPQDERPLYQVIVDDVIQKIHEGQYAAGDQLGSLGDLCAHYDVSMATAHRSISELAKMGVIKTIPRKGAYVVGVPAPPAVKQAEQVQRVILVESLNQRRLKRAAAPGLAGFTDPAVDAIIRVCRHEQIPLEFQFIPVDATAAQRVFFTPRSGDAIIAVGCGVSVALLSHLSTPNVPSVVIDAAAPNAHCVLTDNYAGMHQVVRHLHDAGHRKVALGVCFISRGANSTNENERRDALLHHARLSGLNVATVDSGNWEDLFKTLSAPDNCTAVVFTRDDPALEFIKLARARGLRVPEDVSVVGFDDWAQHPELLNELTTVHVDVAQMGQVATEMVLNPPPNRSQFYVWRRVAPTLVVRSSVANIPVSSAQATRV
jgi:GntR family transcriptional regulator, arabinose operon transcriptional repressor